MPRADPPRTSSASRKAEEWGANRNNLKAIGPTTPKPGTLLGKNCPAPGQFFLSACDGTSTSCRAATDPADPPLAKFFLPIQHSQASMAIFVVVTA